ncbi:peptidylprolyl isomerase [Bacillus sp. CGMCC 1.16607]|uniref:peptidylprolyl isomerase n=1 Tax=Bacillus sp. CGMCC 1.16607 TaxID=3351842 RepID=UPI00362E2353
MKKWMISLSIAAGVIGLSACSQNNADVVVETKAGNITKDELYEAMKDKIGERALQQLLYEKVLTKEYKVTDKELNERLEQIKAELGENFETALTNYGYKNEDEFKEVMKISLLQEKAALKDVKITDKELKEYYDNYKTEIRASHILVADEKTAKEIKDKLDKGGNFEELAKKYSTDTLSAQKGGDLDWFGPGMMVAPFEEAAYALKMNEISNPVKSEHGYHIIKLTDKKEKKPFEEMKKELKKEMTASKVTEETVQKAMDREMKNAKVKIKDKDLKDALELKQ